MFGSFLFSTFAEEESQPNIKILFLSHFHHFRTIFVLSKYCFQSLKSISVHKSITKAQLLNYSRSHNYSPRWQFPTYILVFLREKVFQVFLFKLFFWTNVRYWSKGEPIWQRFGWNSNCRKCCRVLRSFFRWFQRVLASYSSWADFSFFCRE